MGKHRATKRRMKQHPNGHGSRPRFEKTMEGVSNELIFEMAETIGDNQKVPKLALKLGFKIADAERFVAMNRMNGVVSFEGTRKMLCSWRESTPANKQWYTLEAALMKTDLAGIADEFSSMAEGKARNVPSFPMEIRSKPVSGSTDHVVYPEEPHKYVHYNYFNYFTHNDNVTHNVNNDDIINDVITHNVTHNVTQSLTLTHNDELIRISEELQRRYTDPARFAEDTELLNQGFLPPLKRRDSSLENSRHDIFKSPMRRIVVSGSNTAKPAPLCRVLSHDWATQNGACALSENQFLFELSANGIKSNQTIENAIKNQLLPDLHDVDEALIRQLLNERPDKITILLDGANESNCGDNIMDLLTGRTLQKVTVMVTTIEPCFAKMLDVITPGGYDRIYMD